MKLSKVSMLAVFVLFLFLLGCKKNEVAAPLVPGGAIISASVQVQKNSEVVVIKVRHDTAKNTISN